jgi:hypothetical protein
VQDKISHKDISIHLFDETESTIKFPLSQIVHDFESWEKDGKGISLSLLSDIYIIDIIVFCQGCPLMFREFTRFSIILSL